MSDGPGTQPNLNKFREGIEGLRVLRSFDNGLNTADIAKMLGEKESDIDYLLHHALAKRRLNAGK